jgi:hypothetical protein
MTIYLTPYKYEVDAWFREDVQTKQTYNRIYVRYGLFYNMWSKNGWTELKVAQNDADAYLMHITGSFYHIVLIESMEEFETKLAILI